jgi:hypothetical protein
VPSGAGDEGGVHEDAGVRDVDPDDIPF